MPIKIGIALSLALVLGTSSQLASAPDSASSDKSKPKKVIRVVPLQTDFTGARVSPDALIQGCSGKDCIPAIDRPKFDHATAVDWLKNDDIVFVIIQGTYKRVYPQLILNWHEIVNDTIAGRPIAITFCPLCGSAVAYERRVNGVETHFGVSGKLHDSDLVMYDRYEGNLWQQIGGDALVGPAARRKERLKQVHLHTTTWKAWKNAHPNSLVLSRRTGYLRNYTHYPYGTYESDRRIFVPLRHPDDRLHPKEEVIGLSVGGEAKAYRMATLRKKKHLGDTVGGQDINLEYRRSGEIRISTDAGQDVTYQRMFWFAWATFNPGSSLYR